VTANELNRVVTEARNSHIQIQGSPRHENFAVDDTSGRGGWMVKVVNPTTGMLEEVWTIDDWRQIQTDITSQRAQPDAFNVVGYLRGGTGGIADQMYKAADRERRRRGQ
jgi:hypothetical protein